MHSHALRLVVLSLTALLMACEDPVSTGEQVVRSVRTITVNERASGKLRRYSGVVEAASSTNLSFEVPGNVREVLVDPGDSIRQGQVLARLDPASFELNVEAVEANLGRAEVVLSDAEREYARLRGFAARGPGLISEQALDQARVNVEAAIQGVSYAQSRLLLAQRDLARAELLAPFDGVVSERLVDPFQEVSRGQKVFAVHIDGAMEAAVSIPESEIKMVHLGLGGSVQFPALGGQQFAGIVSEVSSTAGAANAFPIRVTIQTADARIRPGLTTEVSLLLGESDEDQSFLVPISAIGFGANEGDNFVFLFDQGRVVRTSIKGDGIRGDNIVVTAGLSAGDVVVTAGVSFLQDGQEVRLLER